MRKKTLQMLLDKTNSKLISVLEENKQYLERIEKYEQLENSADEAQKELLRTNEDLSIKYEKLLKEYELFRSQADEKLNALTHENAELVKQLNSLKGDHFDICRYAEELKIKLEEAHKTDPPASLKEIIPTPPPKVEEIKPLQEKDEDGFDYASSIISKAVVDVAKLKNQLSTTGSEMSNELITLALGKTEMLKSDIIETVMSDMILEAKRQRIDAIYKDTKEYFSSLLGQITIEEGN